MQPTPIKLLNVFTYLIAGLVLVAFVLGTATYLIAGQEAAATAGKVGAGLGVLAGGAFGLTRRFR